MTAIELQGLRKSFKSPAGMVTALDGIDLAIPDGAIVALLGPSGCGKTTILRCIAGLESADEGSIRIGGNVVFDAGRGIDVPPDRRTMGMVFQSYALWPHLTVGRNVAYPLEAAKLPKKEVIEKVDQALTMVGCAAFTDRYPHQLSGGQQQRIAVARAIAAGSKVILFDEPLSNLDTRLRERLRFELVELQARIGFAGVYVTHDHEEALAVAQHIVVLRGGRIEQSGSPRDLFERPRSHFVLEFFNEANFLPGTVVGPDGMGRVSVRTDIGTLSIADPARLAPPTGAPVEIALRADDLRILPGTGTAGRVPAELIRSFFLGRRTVHLVRVGDTDWRVHESAEHTAPPAGAVYLDFDPDRALMFTGGAE